MSLLQEALKRKELDEAQRKPEAGNAEKVAAALPADGATAGVNLSVRQRAPDGKSAIIPQDAPPQSMPAPEQPQADAGQAGRRKIPSLWVIMAASAVLFVLLLAGGTAFFIYRFRPLLQTATHQQDNHIAKTNTVAAAVTNAVIGQPISTGQPETVNSTAVAIVQQVAVPVVQNVDAAKAELKPVAVKPPLVRLKIPKAAAPAKWPVLKLTGILRGSGQAESTAVINGKMLNAGQTIDNATIVEIQTDGVLLKCGAEKKFLRVGATLY